MAFYLFIPFINILIKNLSQKNHLLLISLCLFIYSILYQFQFMVHYNYVSWFSVIYLIAAYIRLYKLPYNDSAKFWGITTSVIFLLSSASVVIPGLIFQRPTTFFLNDCNALFATVLAISAFMFFKNIKISYNKYINAIGATTFGIFLLHTSGSHTRNWLWSNLIDNVNHINDRFFWIYAILWILAVFCIGAAIEYVRLHTIEKFIFDIYDKTTLRFHRQINNR